jgi:prepilin-type N-terminal cleavage/methylation domain-containing protein
LKTLLKKQVGTTCKKGLTLLEAMIAMVMVAVLAIGALSYQYFGIKQLRIAQADLAATRIGQLVLENWKGTGGVDSANYDLTTLGLGFQRPASPTNGNYYITVDGTTYYVWLAYEDKITDSDSGITLRQISATLRRPNNFGTGSVTADDPAVTLITYVRKGQD